MSSACPGSRPAIVASFFAKGMLMNVIAAIQLDDAPEAWAQRLLDGCKND